MKSRRALSTVVGAVFAIIALTSTVTYVSYSMGILDNYNQSVLTKNQQLSDVNKEKFQISSVTIPNNKLNITVVNTGGVPINFTKIWIQNTTSSATTDWVRSYVPTHNFVVPGGVLTNIGQSVNVISANSYNVKLVTSRGNTQQFNINSVGAQPLNIQLLAFPTTVPSGFKSELVMMLINNSTSTLVNVSPNNPTLTINNVANDNPTCVLGGLTPTQYSTIAPGTTAIFTWDITVTGTGGDSCTASFTTPLKGGHAQTLTSPAIKPTAVSLSSTTYSQNSGVVTNDYTAFRWTTDGNTWNTDWAVPSCSTIAFRITISNNNQTAGGYNLWLSKNTQIFFYPTLPPSNGKVGPTTYYIVNSTSKPFGLTPYTDNSIGIPNQGGIATLYLGAASPSTSTPETNSCGGSSLPMGLQANTPYFGSILIYGKFTKNSGDTNGGNYAQSIPFLAILSN